VRDALQLRGAAENAVECHRRLKKSDAITLKGGAASPFNNPRKEGVGR